MQDEEITIEKTILGRAVVKQLQGFASITQLLPQSVVDILLPEEQKKSLIQKLCAQHPPPWLHHLSGETKDPQDAHPAVEGEPTAD